MDLSFIRMCPVYRRRIYEQAEIGAKIVKIERGLVWDKATGAHLLTIKDDRVFSGRTGKEIGAIRDDGIYDLAGDFLCGLAGLDAQNAVDTMPAALKEILS